MGGRKGRGKEGRGRGKGKEGKEGKGKGREGEGKDSPAFWTNRTLTVASKKLEISILLSLCLSCMPVAGGEGGYSPPEKSLQKIMGLHLAVLGDFNHQ